MDGISLGRKFLLQAVLFFLNTGLLEFLLKLEQLNQLVYGVAGWILRNFLDKCNIRGIKKYFIKQEAYIF